MRGSNAHHSMAGSGGGRDVVPVSPRAQQPRRRRGGRRRHQKQAAAWLPLDVVVEIATRSDAATLVRCAATCRDARRRIAEDPNLRTRLRLRDAGRFLLPLLHGHLMGIKTFGDGDRNTDVYLMDTTAADATPIVKANFSEAGTLSKEKDPLPLDSRGGLVLVRARATAYPWHRPLLVCNLATRRRLALPLEPAFPNTSVSTEVQYVLLVGDRDGEAGVGSAVGRPFQVLKAKLMLSENYLHLLVQTFSSELGAWSPCTEIPTSNLHGCNSLPPPLQRRPLVVGDVVHWLCLTNSGSYVLMLHVRAAQVEESALPASFPRDRKRQPYEERHRYLLATASAGGNLIVLVADTDKVSAWEQSKHTKIWKSRPQVVIENEMILKFNDDGLAELVEMERRWRNRKKQVPELVWFGERSGAVLLRIYEYGLLWLDLHSKSIVRFSSLGFRMQCAQMYCPCEVDSSSWVPTFSRTGTL